MGHCLKDTATGSEVAFAELVRKHPDLVYSAALRTLSGDEHLARDVSQTVFMDVGRKASQLSNRLELSDGFTPAAVFAAAKAVRSQRRRQAREQASKPCENGTGAPGDECGLCLAGGGAADTQLVNRARLFCLYFLCYLLFTEPYKSGRAFLATHPDEIRRSSTGSSAWRAAALSGASGARR